MTILQQNARLQGKMNNFLLGKQQHAKDMTINTSLLPSTRSRRRLVFFCIVLVGVGVVANIAVNARAEPANWYKYISSGRLSKFDLAQPTYIGARQNKSRETGSVSPITSENHEKFVEMLTSRFEKKAAVFLSYVDLPFVEVAANFYETSIKAHGLTQFIFAVSGADCCVKLVEYGVPVDVCFVYVLNETSSTASSFGSRDFIRKMNIRTDMILDALRAGFSVGHSDIDVFFVKNPLPTLERACPTCDVAALWDSFVYNAGFIYVRSTPSSIFLYERMQNMSLAGTKLDDQQQLNSVIRQMTKSNNSIHALKLSTKEFLCGKAYFEEGRRVFAGDRPCPKCIVIHNNWIVSDRAKIYRFREHHMWVIDSDEYYSSTTTKYLTFDLPLLGNNTRELEMATLANALAIGQVLNRTVILPKFHCRRGKFVKLCPLNDLVMLTNFDAKFANAYREHTFLAHPKVPAIVKQSLSPYYRINSTQSPGFKTIYTEAVGSQNNPIIVLPHSGESGATSDEILQCFGNVTESVLRFHSLYHAFGNFTSSFEHNLFFTKVKEGIVTGNYRQYMYGKMRNHVIF